MIYECLTGDYPFDFAEGAPFTAVLVQICSDEPRSLRAHCPPIPIHVAVAVDEALVRDHDNRIKTAQGFTNVLGPGGAAAFEDTELPPPEKIREVFDSLRPEPTDLDAVWPIDEDMLADDEWTDIDAAAVVDPYDDPTTADPAPTAGDAAPLPVAEAQNTANSNKNPLLYPSLVAVAIVALAVAIGVALVSSTDAEAEPAPAEAHTTASASESVAGDRQPEPNEPIAPQMVELAEPEPAEVEPTPETSTQIRVEEEPVMRTHPRRGWVAMQTNPSAEPTPPAIQEPSTPPSRSGVVVGEDEW